MTEEQYSIVEYYSSHEGYSCGYCKGRDTNYSHGMWANTLTAQDYQDLIDRGWRRSGCFCYKPTMDVICCPMYTIKCEALNFKVTKSQRKILKKVGRFLRNETTKHDKMETNEDDMCNDIDINVGDAPHFKRYVEKVEKDPSSMEVSSIHKDLNAQSSKVVEGEGSCESKKRKNLDDKTLKPKCENKESGAILQTLATAEPTSSRGPCRKAKLLRIERKKNKLLAQGKTLEEIEAMFRERKERNKQQNKAKSLEELFDDACTGSKKLEIQLVRVMSDEFIKTFDASASLYQKYQMTIHGDKPHKCNKKTFFNFLVKSPLQHWKPADGPPHGYGSFHELYWLNNELIAVGVIDILPSCVSSVYFFYDPDYSHLSLGTFSSLREVYLTRQLNKVASNLKYYYMGFYIHTCPKMRYKARMRPSKLLCPETHVWCDIESCIEKLNKEKYCRFNDDIDAIDEDGVVDIEKVLILYQNAAMPYKIYSARVRGGVSRDEKNEIVEYAGLVGMKCAQRLLLYRRSSNS